MTIGDHPPSEGDAGHLEKKKKTFGQKVKRDIQKPRVAVEVVALGFLILYTCFTGYQSCKMRVATEATKHSADAALLSAQTAQRQLELSERPWVSIDQVVFGSPLVFDQNGGRITLQFLLRNTGNSPAEYVNIDGEFIPFPLSKERWYVPIEQRRLCDAIRLQTFKMSLVTLFPNTTSPYSVTFTMNPTDIAQGLIYPEKRDWITPIIIGCIDYRFEFANGHHQTGFSYYVMHKPGEIVIHPQGTIESNTLWLESWEGNYSD
jgi:hypothetical protein